MKATIVGLFLLAATMSAVCTSSAAPTIIPVPKKLQQRDGTFELKSGARIVVDPSARPVGEYLAERLRKSTGFSLKVAVSSKSEPANNEILLTTGNFPAGNGDEAYTLTVAPRTAAVRAGSEAGLFYGVISLLQLLPPEALSSTPIKGRAWTIPCVQVDDQPRFVWRGYLLDVARHFFTKDEIKQVMDEMSFYKMNRLQLHLTDDQGWRLEIKKHPRLTEIAGWRNSIGFGLDPKAATAYGPDGRYGGFYTQADMRELIAYGKARQITIVPEIEMPGHAGGALSAYPQFSCSGGPYNTDTGGAFAGVYCAGQDETYAFLENVLTEVCQLFPGKYIHIGGDEVSKENWQKCPRCQARMKQEGLKTEHELQSYFVRRAEKMLNARGRTLVGWTEIREGGLAQNATIMDWIGGAVESAREGHDVIMSPTKYCYLDYYQSTNQTAEPKAIGGYLPLSQVYAFDPLPAELEPQYRAHIIGAQGNLWTEYIASLKHAQYMTFPRLCALAEVAWSPQASRNYEDFLSRLQMHVCCLDQLGINYRRASLAPASKE